MIIVSSPNFQWGTNLVGVFQENLGNRYTPGVGCTKAVRMALSTGWRVFEHSENDS